MGFYDVYHGANEMVKELCIELVRMSDEHMTEVREAKRMSDEHMAEVREAKTGVDSMTDEELLEHGLVRMPKDADGVPIYVGDMLDGYGKTIEVVEMRYGRGGWVLISRDGNGYADTFAFAHRHEPTVEDVLRDFAEGLGVPVADSYIASSAAKLRLAKEGE